jgi:pimeloyl-ACP methyl ester carboxylesterase
MKKKIFAALIVVLFLVALPHIDDRFQAISIMLHVMDPETNAALAKYRQVEVREDAYTFDGVNSRRYIPAKRRSSHAMVVVHGVHRLGIDEPRLIAFSRALAAQGIEVLTPQLPGIADFRVSRDSVVTIGEAAKELRRLSGAKVGIFGLSFSGGLALIAAADPRYRDDIEFVVAVGAHHSMERVAHFFVTDEAMRPDGSVQKIPAHEYGPLVLIYSHPEDFFAANDVPAARACLHNVLYEVTCDASSLSAGARQIMSHVFAHDKAFFHDAILASAEGHKQEYADESPEGKLGGLRAKVLLLHGAGDDVIPPTETEWLAREIPPGLKEEVLISPAISHVEMGAKPGLVDQYRVVEFIAEMVEEAED